MVVYSTYLQFVTSCSFHSVCPSLWGLRSYSIMYVNFKVLHIRRGNDGIFTHLFAAFFHFCSSQNGIGRPTFLWQRSTPVIVDAGSRDARGKIKKWCASPAGLCPWVGDPCHKWNSTLNRSLATLQLSCSFCYCVNNLWRTNVVWRGMWRSKNFHLFQSFHHYQPNSEFWENLFSALCHVVCSYYAY